MNIALKKECFALPPQPDKSRQLVDFLRAHYDDRRAGKPMRDQITLIAMVEKLIDERADPGKRCENTAIFSGPAKNTSRPDLSRESALDIAIREKDWDLVRVMEAVVSRRQT